MLAREYNVSSATLITIGLEVIEKLTAEVKVYLSNRNDLRVELTPEVLKSLKQEETRHALKRYFKNGESLSALQLSDDTQLHFVKIYRNSGVSIKKMTSRLV